MGASKSGLRLNNEDHLGAWLHHVDPDRSAARCISDQPIEAFQHGSRVILRGGPYGAYERIDEFYDWKERAKKLQENAEKADAYKDSDRELLELFGDWLPKNDPYASSAIEQFIRTESVSSGWEALEYMEAEAKGGHPYLKIIAPVCRRGIEAVLDELDRRNFKLDVGDAVVDFYEWKQERRSGHEKRRRDRDNRWRLLYGWLLIIMEEEGVGKEKAKKILADRRGVSVRTIGSAINFCEKANAAEFL